MSASVNQNCISLLFHSFECRICEVSLFKCSVDKNVSQEKTAPIVVRSVKVASGLDCEEIICG